MNTKNKHIIIQLLNIFLPLIFGFCIYLFLYGQIPLFLFFQKHFGIIPFYKTNNFLLEFSRNYICDAFWTYSMFFSLSFFVKSVKFVSVVCMGTGMLLEVLQGVHLISGTFDFLDVFFELIAVFTALSINKYFLEKGEQLWKIYSKNSESSP